MRWTLQLFDQLILLLRDGVELKRRSLSEGDVVGAGGNIAQFEDWATRYEKAVKTDLLERSKSYDLLLAIGREIAAWLDERNGCSVSSAARATSSSTSRPGKAPPDQARAFLNVPWELLATGAGFLALDPVRLFCVQRRLGRATAPLKPQASTAGADVHGRLASGHAAGPRLRGGGGGHPQGDRSACRRADGRGERLPGIPPPRLANEGPFEALHLSCHGDIGKDGPKLLLEEPGGRASRSPPPPTSSRPSAPTSRAWCSSPPAARPNMKRKARRSPWSCCAPACPPCSAGTAR